MRDLARFMVGHRAKQDWTTIDIGDVEAFLSERPFNRRRRLQAARQFFRWARRNKIVLIDPTRDLPGLPRRGFSGQTLSIAEQRRLFRRWASEPGIHPHESLVGILALLHDEARQTLRVRGRPLPVPLDPVSVSVVCRSLAYRATLGTHNPHLIVTAQTKTRSTPASAAYLAHVLDAATVAPKRLRTTRIVDLVLALDPKVVGEVLGMRSEGLVDYLADRVDPGRMSETG